jgi:amino acid transporter
MEDSNGPTTERKTASSSGLKQAVLSPNETLAQSIALIAPTAAPLLTVPLVFASAGPGCWLAFVISTFTIVLVALNINQFARTSSSPGSLYTYIVAHMHPVLGIVAGWALLIAYIGTATAIGAGLTNYLNVIVKDLTGIQVFPVLLAIIGIGLAAWLAYCDVTVSVRLMLGLEAVSMTLISFVACGILIRNGFHLDISQLKLEGVTPEKLRMGLVLAIFCLVGFESATSLGSEAKDPLRSIPRAVTWSAILAGAFFVFCAYTEVLGFRGEAVGLDKSLAPLHVLARKAGLPLAIGVIIDFGAVVSFFSCLLACITAAARVLFLMGQHGTMHSQLGAAHGSRQTPHRAVVLSAFATLLPLAVLMFRGVDGIDIYGLAGTVATFGFLTAYILVSVAAPMYLRSRGRLTARDMAISVLAVIAMGVALLGSLYPVPPAPYSLLPYIYGGLLLAGFTWSMVWNTRSPIPMAQIQSDLKALAD